MEGAIFHSIMIELVVTYNKETYKYNCESLQEASKILHSYIGMPDYGDFHCEMNLSEDYMNFLSRFQKEQIIKKRIEDLEKDFE